MLVVTGHALGSAAEDPRPFIVETAEGRIRALGTRFAVRQNEDHTRVAVVENVVEITPALTAGTPWRLQAGERASFTRTGVNARLPLGEDTIAWINGQIVAIDMPLGEFVAELARYRPGVVRCDPEVANLRISGVFPLQDTDSILAALPNVLPVHVKLRTRYWVVVEAAA